MRKVFIIGIGVGDPEQLTLQAIHALNQADVVFVLDKGEAKADLRELRHEICRRFIEKPYRVVQMEDPVRDPQRADYAQRVQAWHAERAANYARMFSELGETERAAILVWGDPALYDSTLRILERVRDAGTELDYEVIPGISSVQLLAARHRIPLNRIGGSVLITTGRKLLQGLPPDVDDAVVMLDGECTWQTLVHEPLDIYWGAYLGSPKELLRAGKLSEVSDEIIALRSNARAQHGWIMDIYLLRRRKDCAA